MTMPILPLAALLAAPPPPSQVIAVRAGAPLYWGAFSAAVAAHAQWLQGRAERRWALFHSDTYTFAIGLFALLHSGKTVLLPGNAQPGTVAELDAEVEAFLGEFPAPATRPLLAIDADAAGTLALQALSPTAVSIELMTSGSTGGAKIVGKNLQQIAAEIDCQEQLWGARLGAATVLATVSHQHIYGLLFRLLWPLCSGRPFAAHTAAYLETVAAEAAALPRVVLVSSPAHLKRLPPALDWAPLRGRFAAVFSSGGPLPAETAQQWRAQLQTPLEIFGSTETGGVAWRAQDGAAAPLWTPLPAVQCRLAADGTLAVHSPYVGGTDFYPMGDRAALGDDGRFELLGRADQVVKLEEKRVSLTDLGARLCTHAWVADARALALPGARASLGAVVELNAAGRAHLEQIGKRAFSAALREHLLQFFERVLLPRKWRYVDQLPCNSQGKTTRAELLALFAPALPGRVLQQSAGELLLAIDIDAENPVFAGHFPGLPVLPGVVQLDWAIRHSQRCWYAAQVFQGIDQLKFQEVIVPGQTLQLRLADCGGAAVEFSYRNGERLLSSGRIRFGAGDGV